MSSLDFLGVLQRFCCQFCCQESKDKISIDSRARNRAGSGDAGPRILPNPPFGISPLSLSTNVFHPLQKPIEFLPSSTEIYCCLSVLLSTTVAWKQFLSVFPGHMKSQKERLCCNNDWYLPYTLSYCDLEEIMAQ
jgi:hypothetical protein